MGAPELRDLECFLVIAEELHFGRAAERLYVSQARVSQRLQDLESRIGGRLVERSSRRVRLTPLGESFRDDLLPSYTALLAAVEQARRTARGVCGTLRVGFVGTPNAAVLGAVRAFRARHPGTEVDVVEMALCDPVGPLLRDEVDLLFVCLPVDEPGVTVGPVVLTEPRVLAVSVHDSLAGRDAMDAEELAGRTMIDVADPAPPEWRARLAPRVTPAGLAITRGPAARTLQEALSLVAAGRGVLPLPALLADYHARPDVAFVPVHGLPDTSLALVWRTEAESVAIRAFVAAASDNAHF